MDGLERNGYSEEEKDKKKKKKICSSSSNSMMMMRCCQVEKCNTDLQDAKQYHKRHKVCEYHAKAQVVILAGTQQRFCQQCSRFGEYSSTLSMTNQCGKNWFHELAEFDETKRSCRRRLAGHNERRRKNSDQSHSQPEGSSRNGSASGPRLKDDDRAGKFQLTVEEDAKHFQT